MKKVIIILIAFCLTASICDAGQVYTTAQVEILLMKECKTSNVILFDEVYEEYSLSRALLKADNTNHIYTPDLYDCEDIAISVKSIVTRHILEVYRRGGAVMIGIALITEKGSAVEEEGHVVNICIYNDRVYLYDQQVDPKTNVITVTSFLKDGGIIHYVIM